MYALVTDARLDGHVIFYDINACFEEEKKNGANKPTPFVEKYIVYL